MENNLYTSEPIVEAPAKKEGSVLRGLIGAVIAAVIAAVIWAVIGVVTERVFALVGFGIGLLICFGYDLLKGKTGWIRAVIVAICVIVAVVAGDVFAYGYWTVTAYDEEVEFIATATKQELAEVYLSEEELAELNAMPSVLKEYALESLEVEMPSKEEYMEMMRNSEDLRSGFMKDCAQSVFFALLGSFTLILQKSKNEKAAASAEQSLESARVGAAEEEAPVQTIEAEQEAAQEVDKDTAAQA